MKKFERMSSKKLTALLATASAEDQVTIQAILDARTQAAARPEDEDTLTPEQEAAIAEAEKNGGLNPLYNGSKSSLEKAPKMSDEELEQLAEKCRENLNHKCQVVPFNTVDWVDGHIAGVIIEKRARKVMYAVKTVDGRRIVKVCDSNLIKISEEVIEIVKKEPKTASPRVKKEPKTVEEIEALVKEHSCNVGKVVEVVKDTLTNEQGEEQKVTEAGRIVSIMVDRRSSAVFYKIALASGTISYKTLTSPQVTIAEDFDDEGQELNAKFIARREAQPVTKQERIVRAQEALQRAEERLEKVKAEIERHKQTIAALMQDAEAPAAETTEEESLD